MEGPPLLIPPRGAPPLRIESTEKTSEPRKAAKPNQRKAVTAWASRHLLLGSSEPAVTRLEWMKSYQAVSIRVFVTSFAERRTWLLQL